MPLTDTNLSARSVQLMIYKSMSGEQLLALAFTMSDFARELAKQGIRDQHPDWSEKRVLRELIRLAFLPFPLPAQLQ